MRIRIVGAGTMGRGIAQWAVMAGHTVELADARPEAVPEAVSFVRAMLERAAEKGRMGRADADRAAAALVELESPYAAGGAEAPGLVIEAVLEDLDTKAELFTGLERALPAATVFATNTSSLSVTRIGARLGDPGRLAGLHFFNPVPLMRLVEVVPGAATREEVPEFLAALVAESGHHPVTVADTPGFLVNHAGRGLVTEAFALLEESVAGHPAIDRIARDVLGLRMGPFELMDLTGLDVTAAVMDTVWDGFRHADRLRPSYLPANRVAAGLHGAQVGAGLLLLRRGRSRARTARAPDRGRRPRAGRTAGRGRTRRTGHAAGTRGRRALVLVPTWGTSVSAAVAAADGLPAGRTLGVDPLSLGTPRRVLAVTPATDGQAVRDAVAVLARDGHAVSVVRDTAGSVAQRLLASIVNVATGIAERGIAAPDDIDTAVTLGLGYPHGPLAWADTVGSARILSLLRALAQETGDPRYRPTPWLTHRANLGLPLRTPMPDLPE